jgi:hypothetical protein
VEKEGREKTRELYEDYTSILRGSGIVNV